MQLYQLFFFQHSASALSIDSNTNNRLRKDIAVSYIHHVYH